MEDFDTQFSDNRHMPSYESSFIKEKTPGALLARLESRLRNPFTLDMEFEMQFLMDLQFALQVDKSQKMDQYKIEVNNLRNLLSINAGWLGKGF